MIVFSCRYGWSFCHAGTDDRDLDSYHPLYYTSSRDCRRLAADHEFNCRSFVPCPNKIVLRLCDPPVTCVMRSFDCWRSVQDFIMPASCIGRNCYLLRVSSERIRLWCDDTAIQMSYLAFYWKSMLKSYKIRSQFNNIYEIVCGFVT